MLFIIGCLLAIVATVILGFLKPDPEGRDYKELRTTKRIVVSVLYTVSLLGIIFSTIATVSTGHVGIQSVFGKVDETQTALPEGLHMINPFADVIELDIRTRKFDMNQSDRPSVPSRSSEGLTMIVEGTAQFKLHASEAPFIYKKVGPEFVDQILYPAIRSSIRSTTPNYTAIPMMTTKRTELADKINEAIDFKIREIMSKQFPEYTGKPFTVKFVLRDVSAPAKVNEAINQKLQAEQEAEREDHRVNRERKAKTWELEKEQLEAQRKAIEAEGIAEFQRIVSEEISDKLIHWKWLDTMKDLAGSENTTFIFAPDGRSLPIQPIMNFTE